MSTFSGKQAEGARRRNQERKRIEAEVRNEATLPENRKAARKAAANG